MRGLSNRLVDRIKRIVSLTVNRLVDFINVGLENKEFAVKMIETLLISCHRLLLFCPRKRPLLLQIRGSKKEESKR